MCTDCSRALSLHLDAHRLPVGLHGLRLLLEARDGRAVVLDGDRLTRRLAIRALGVVDVLVEQLLRGLGVVRRPRLGDGLGVEGTVLAEVLVPCLGGVLTTAMTSMSAFWSSA
jgi:hypothetical protein